MKKEKNSISTKDELISSFNKEQMDIYNYYLNKFSYSNDELLPTIKEDKEIAFLENSYGMLKKVLKVELVMGLIIATIVLVFGQIPKGDVSKATKEVAIVEEIDY